MIIFDTTFLVDLMRSYNNSNYKRAISYLKEVTDSDETFATTFANVFELYKGAHKSDNPHRSIEKIDYILKLIPVLEFNRDYYDSYGKISAALEKKGTPIGKFDELIAAIAIYHNAGVVTNNTRDFSRVPGIEVINH
ncbi:type II toxin-antitoxin system VapC family toxin [Methanoplanus endosymbiosus]|uniref:Ribonuclease VapC n=1 Tax=Methanoplanus endosymbiosus TaxID=33865 RepID=A0A9E7TMF6_9EURY|nr:type II toxin-antitoxin system VapC family toxin [Methanoplanus endosymbiosus]UUX93211.1 type II toxin-antitoxin system VapC family toxin [Methanoplanus endosymbiosus]